MIQADDIEAVGEEDSDDEQELKGKDEKQLEEPTEQGCDDHSFLTNVMESFVDKISMLKTRAGRAGLVHNFLRGLHLMTAPVASGELVITIVYTRPLNLAQYFDVFATFCIQWVDESIQLRILHKVQ